MHSGDASFARSFDPCTSILTMLRGASFGGEAFESASRLGKLGQPRGTNTGAGAGGRSAARRVSPLPQGRGRGTSKKRKEIEVSVPARIEEFGFGCSHVVVQLQKSVGDVWPRISSANALQKGRQGRVNRGLAPRSRRWVKPRAGNRGETTIRTSASPLNAGEDRRQAQGGERSPLSGRNITPWCCDRGTGAVMATGSCEESLPAEGIPVITKRRLSRDGADGGLGGFDILRPVPTLRRAGRTARLQHARKRVRREDERRNRDTDVRGSVASAP